MDDLKNMGVLSGFERIDDNIDDDDVIDTNDKNREGIIRYIRNAHLIYKRKNETNRYDELWVYHLKSNGMYQDITIKKDILSGTDIPVDKLVSNDGEQHFDVWNVGNIIFLKIFNLAN